MIHGILQDYFISASVILEYAAWPVQVGHGRPAWMLNRSVTERQGNDRFRRELLTIEIGAHDGGAYQKTSGNPSRERHG
jgi:hypothetical protein